MNGNKRGEILKIFWTDFALREWKSPKSPYKPIKVFKGKCNYYEK